MKASEIICETMSINVLGITEIYRRSYGNGYYIEPTVALELETETGETFFGLIEVDEAFKTSIHSEDKVACGLKWGMKEVFLENDRIEIVSSKPAMLDDDEIDERVREIYNG